MRLMRREQLPRGAHLLEPGQVAYIAWWDMLFGTYRNPREFRATCGFDAEKEKQLLPMLGFRDVHKE